MLLHTVRLKSEKIDRVIRLNIYIISNSEKKKKKKKGGGGGGVMWGPFTCCRTKSSVVLDYNITLPTSLKIQLL